MLCAAIIGDPKTLQLSAKVVLEHLFNCSEESLCVCVCVCVCVCACVCAHVQYVCERETNKKELITEKAMKMALHTCN